MAFFGTLFPGLGEGGSSAWEDKVWQMLAEACAAQADRNNMSYGAGEPFADATDLTLTNAVVESGYCRNTVTAGTSGGNTITDTSKLSDSGHSGVNVAANAGDYTNSTYWVSTTSTGWLRYDETTATTVMTYTMLLDSQTIPYTGAMSWQLQGSNTGANGSWNTLDTQTSQSFTANVKRTFTLASLATYRYYQLIFTAATGGYAAVNEWELLGVGTPGSVNAATITLAPVTLTNPVAGKIIFTGYNADATAILDVGTNVHVYPMLGGSQGSELTFTSESLGNNKWRFVSDDIDLSGVSTLGVRFTNTTSRNMRLYEAMIVWRDE